MSLCVVTTTLPGQAEAEALARQLVEERLVACVQMTPITSVYRWEGNVETAPEVRLDCKTTEAKREALLARLSELHPYDVPEVLVTQVEASEGYAAWAAAETKA
ncbi:MAG: divalent-cation tolerance protein CutA [Pseudomonadota bacterium]